MLLVLFAPLVVAYCTARSRARVHGTEDYHHAQGVRHHTNHQPNDADDHPTLGTQAPTTKTPVTETPVTEPAGNGFGKAKGFAKDVTGGGNADCHVPASNKQLEDWLFDTTPRCILLDREFDFTGSMGIVKGMGCKPSTYCGAKGQLALDIAPNPWCKDNHYPEVPVTYDLAAIADVAMRIGSDKTLRGVGKKGVIRGRGLKIADARNVIIQNLTIRDLNEAFIWGGDGITLQATDLVLIDRVVFRNIGRQDMYVGHKP